SPCPCSGAGTWNMRSAASRGGPRLQMRAHKVVHMTWLGGVKSRGVDPPLNQRACQHFSGLVTTLVAEWKDTPMSGYGVSGFQSLEDHYSFIRIDMLIAHEPSGRIGANWQQRNIRRTHTLTDGAKK